MARCEQRGARSQAVRHSDTRGLGGQPVTRSWVQEGLAKTWASLGDLLAAKSKTCCALRSRLCKFGCTTPPPFNPDHQVPFRVRCWAQALINPHPPRAVQVVPACRRHAELASGQSSISGRKMQCSLALLLLALGAVGAVAGRQHKGRWEYWYFTDYDASEGERAAKRCEQGPARYSRPPPTPAPPPSQWAQQPSP